MVTQTTGTRMLLKAVTSIFIVLYGFTELSLGAIEPKVLLPFYGNYQVNYTINAEEGCYQWKSLREEVATISPIETTYNSAKKCSQSAIVVVMSTQPIRKTTLVLATNVKTGTVFQCDVIVDRIHEIDIISRTRELYLADPPEELKIRALDSEGNTFSSTAGMEFEWSLAQDETSRKDDETRHPPVSAHSILHIQKFLDTIYIADPYVDVLENKGKMSDTILISGIQTGAAVVVADLVSTLECHRSVNPSSVRFIVKDKVMLNPTHDVYLLRHAVIQYKVERWREGIPTEITMPSPQYDLNVRDISAQKGTVITLDKETSVVVGLNTGHSQVYLIDQHLKHYDDSLMEQATSDVYVAEPAYLRFEIEPYNRWILEVDSVYEITVHIYNEDNKRIWPSDNVRLNGNLNEDYLEILDSVKNGTWYLVRTLKKGSCDISSMLKGVVNFGTKLTQAGLFSQGSENLEVFETQIYTSQNLEIFDQITVYPPAVLFPWQPEEIQYKYMYQASGGSGNYTWSVNETDSSTVSYTGEVTVHSGSEENVGPRMIEIVATDIRNSYHFGNASAILSPPTKLKFALSRLEAEVESVMNLYVGMYAEIGGKSVPFTDCSLMRNLRWSIHDVSIFEFASKMESVDDDNSDPVPQSPSCLQRKVRALKEGHTTVSISYVLSEETLQASTVIAAFNPLKVKDPSNLAVVSLGSLKIMVFEGGPNPWPLLPNNHEKIIKGNNKFAEFKPKISGKEHTFYASCVHLGDVLVMFTIRNRPCSTNPFPQTSEIEVRLSCAVPTSLKISSEYLPPGCPLYQNQNVQTVALSGDTLQVTLSAFDKLGNQFDNFTSLAKKWKFNSAIEPSFSKCEFMPDLYKQTKHFITYDVLVPKESGSSDLQVIIEEYKDNVDRSLCSTTGCSISPPVKTSIMLDVVTALKLVPQTVVMFNRPNYSSMVEIYGGSGHFEHKIKSESAIHGDIVTAVTSDSSDRSITLNPLSAGNAVLIVSDLCIPKATQVSNAKPRASIVVSDLSSLFLKVTNLLEVGTSGKASIQLDMKELSAPDSFNINIELSLEPEDVLSIEQPKKGEDLVFYADINALKIGTTSVKATTTSRDGKTITSNTVKVTVFPPLLLKPSRITVIRGSEFHLYTEGGPPEDVQVYYDVDDPTIASSSTSGVLTAHKIGNTTVSVRAVTKDGQVFHGRSKCLVHVVQIKGVLIDIPTHRFYTGATVPVHVYGYAGPGYDPVDLDSDAAGLVFSWNVNNHAVLGINSVFTSSGIHVSDKLKFTMLLKGKAQGQASVSVSVSATKLSLRQLTEPRLEAEMQVTVFDPLSVQNTADKIWSSTNNLLLTPETSFNLLSNRDGVAAKLEYTSLCSTCTLNISTQNTDACITVNDELKTITSGKNPCQATILVTASERFNVIQTLAIHVKVKMVSYIITDVEETFYTREPDAQLSGFPLGSKLSLQIWQFDNFGLRFDATKADPLFYSNRNDLLEVTPRQALHTLLIKAAKTGVTIFKIWSEKNNAYNFPLPVVSTIKGEESEVVIPNGIKKCFMSSLVGPEGENGRWSISKPYSVAIDSETGAVIPLSKLSGDVKFELETVSAKISVSSEPFTARFQRNLPDFITNVKSKFILPIEISDESQGTCDGLEKEMIEFAKTTFNCTGFIVNTIEPMKIFDISSAYIKEINSYACVLDRINLAPNIIEKLSTYNDAYFTLGFSVKPSVSDRGISIQSPVNLRFHPAFKLINESQITMTEHTISLCVSATLEIHDSTEVIVDSRNFEIHPPGEYNDGIVCRELSYAFNSDFTPKHDIKVYSTLTGQEEIVKVSIKWPKSVRSSSSAVQEIGWTEQPSPGQPWIYQYSYTYWGVIFAVLVIIITTILLCSSCGVIKWVSSSTQAPQQPPVPSPGPRRSPPGMVPYSPSNSYLFSRSSPVQRSSPTHSGSPSPRRPQLWSTFYQPQNAQMSS